MKRWISVMFLLVLWVFFSCKTKQNTGDNQGDSLSSGTVSHQYRAGGCATVIIISASSSLSDPVILIPKDPLPAKLDVDGKKVKFRYHPLRMPNPKGCNAGFPAEILDIRAE